MSISNERSASLLRAGFRALHATLSRRDHPADVPGSTQAEPEPGYVSHTLTKLMQHGGLYTLLDRDMMSVRLVAMLAGPNTVGMQPEDIDSFINSVSSQVASFFSHLKPATKYTLDSSLISHICFPHEGLVYAHDRKMDVGPESEIPAAFTFVGQFIDHDLTMNGVNLFDPQTGPVQNTASPLLDLDSVYGPRTLLAMLPPPATPGGMSLPDALYNPDGTFKLTKMGSGSTCYWDLPRDPQTHKAYIADARNDENQMILQIHLLLMRVHNVLMRTVYTGPANTLQTRMAQAYIDTLLNWQSVILDDYLTRILEPGTRTHLLQQIALPDFGDFKYKPLVSLVPGADRYVASLPHEFAIGFRMGHSQLRPKYRLQSGGQPVPLFNNSLRPDPVTGHVDDLRGSQPLAQQHVIDFDFFADTFKSNLIDGKVTHVVFDLPESTIPDDIKFIGNLAQRNLIRSSQVGLCSGEDLAAFYGIPALTPKQVDPTIQQQDESDPVYRLYLRQRYDSDGLPVQDSGKPVMEFATPLWFYLLKEAEHTGVHGSLGLLGSRLIGEVILGAIAWGRHSVLLQPRPTSIPTAMPGKVTLLDLVHFVQNDCA